MRKANNHYEFDMKEIVWVLNDYTTSFQESEHIDITYELELDGELGIYNIDIYIKGDNTEYVYKYCLPYPARVIDVYDVLSTINDDVIYYLYSKHICEIKRGVI